eukprot:3254604-Rhodomonas_salina.1
MAEPRRSLAARRTLSQQQNARYPSTGSKTHVIPVARHTLSQPRAPHTRSCGAAIVKTRTRTAPGIGKCRVSTGRVRREYVPWYWRQYRTLRRVYLKDSRPTRISTGHGVGRAWGIRFLQHTPRQYRRARSMIRHVSTGGRVVASAYASTLWHGGTRQHAASV